MHNPPVILVADDDVGFQEIVGTKLKRNGFLVAEAHDGAEAVEKAELLHPDLILMDINMPGESGTEAVLDLVQNTETKNVKVVFLTNQADPWPAVKGEVAKIAKELGATDFINKSDDLDEIAEKVKGFLGIIAHPSTSSG
jgi:two-component system sensor histidine kinase/response regulator